MSRTSNRNVKKKLDTKKDKPLPTEEKEPENNVKDKNKLTDDILHDKSVTRFILEEDVLNLFPISGTSSGSRSSCTDDLEERSTKAVKAEYGLVERILYGEETYENYNQEFDQWTQNFKYLRISGNGVKIPSNWRKTPPHFEEETISEHCDPIDILSPESAFYKEIKTIIKETVINNILENVVVNTKQKNLNQRQRWKKREKSSGRGSSREQSSFIPVPNNIHKAFTSTTLNKQHPIIRSDISSAKWQKAKEDTYEFPVVSSRGFKKNSNIKTNNVLTSKKFTQETKSFNLPPIKGLTFEPDMQNKGFFLRSNSCNTYTKQPFKKKSSFRSSSSKVDS